MMNTAALHTTVFIGLTASIFLLLLLLVVYPLLRFVFNIDVDERFLAWLFGIPFAVVLVAMVVDCVNLCIWLVHAIRMQ
jgi:hypothetical protein